MNAPTSDDLDGRLAPAKLRAVLANVCQVAGFDPRDAELIKFTNNAVFRLIHDPVVVRIAGSAAVANRVEKIVNVARWLEEHRVPAVRLLPGLHQPIAAGGHLATIWKYVSTVGQKPTGTDLARLLRRLHALPAPSFRLPDWWPLNAIRERLAEAEGLDSETQAFLVEKCDEVADSLRGIRYVLPSGFIHGDATIANLIPGQDGPVLCDFDSSSIGPREWDLTPVAVGRFRFIGSSNQHTPVATEYGFDVTTWDGFAVLRQVRELQLVTSVVPILRSNPRVREQFYHRLRTFRAGDLEARWTLYR